MIQLIINGTPYPETRKDRYKCYTEDMGNSVRMISSRLITEVRATVTMIEYSYDYFKDPLMKKCLTDLRANKNLEVRYLDPESGTLKESVFRCTKQPAPTFAFSSGGAARWHNISFKLEEVEGR